MQTIEITFKELRTISASVIDFMKKEYWWESHKGFKTEIEIDLGITGDDAVELMSKFSDRFRVDLKSFRFDKHFNPEPTSYDPFLLILVCLMLVGFILKIIAAAIVFPFNKHNSKKIWEYNLVHIWNRWNGVSNDEGRPGKISYLKISDLIASAVKGEFIQREYTQFKLNK